MGNDIIRPSYRFIHYTFPKYLEKLPFPKDWNAFLKLNNDEWLRLVPFIVTFLFILVVQCKGLMALFARKESSLHSKRRATKWGRTSFFTPSNV